MKPSLFFGNPNIRSNPRYGGPHAFTTTAQDGPHKYNEVDVVAPQLPYAAAPSSGMPDVPFVTAYGAVFSAAPFGLDARISRAAAIAHIFSHINDYPVQTPQAVAIGGPAPVTVNLLANSVLPAGRQGAYPLLYIKLIAPPLTVLNGASVTVKVSAENHVGTPVVFDSVEASTTAGMQFTMTRVDATGGVVELFLIPLDVVSSIPVPMDISLANQYDLAGALPVTRNLQVAISGLPDSTQVTVNLPTYNNPLMVRFLSEVVKA